MLSKFTSRKFITCMIGILTGVLLIISGENVEGTATLISSVVTYCISEGYVDVVTAKRIGVSVTDNIGKDVSE